MKIRRQGEHIHTIFYLFTKYVKLLRRFYVNTFRNPYRIRTRVRYCSFLLFLNSNGRLTINFIEKCCGNNEVNNVIISNFLFQSY